MKSKNLMKAALILRKIANEADTELSHLREIAEEKGTLTPTTEAMLRTLPLVANVSSGLDGLRTLVTQYVEDGADAEDVKSLHELAAIVQKDYDRLVSAVAKIR